LSPRSEAAFEALEELLETAAKDQRGSGAGGPMGAPQPLGGQGGLRAPPGGLRPLGGGAGGPTGPAPSLLHLQPLQRLDGGQGSNSGAKRFKPLSILVPDVPSQPILAAAGAAAAGRPSQSAPSSASAQRPVALPPNGLPGPAPGQGTDAGGAGPSRLVAAAMALGGGRRSLSGLAVAGGQGGGSAMDVDGGGAGGGAGFFGRPSLDGTAGLLGSLHSPLHTGGGGGGLFGRLSMDGAAYGMRVSSTGLGLERGMSVGLAAALESPDRPMGLDAALRGLAPMEGLDWPSPSPR
jgi:translation initiation factor IF-2